MITPLATGLPMSKKPKIEKAFDMSRYSKRYIALKFAYLGWPYQGLAAQSEPTALPTVEEVLFEALEKGKLIESKAGDGCRYSRCGRTDRGVSAFGQVCALEVRSNGPLDVEGGGTVHVGVPSGAWEELPYVEKLNRLLPPSIRVLSWTPEIPADFSARFSCSGRHYKYFLMMGNGLDIEAMREAAGYFVGEHDFRNFCKLDPTKQITNFKRGVKRATISPVSDENQQGALGMFVFDLEGTAFLWHQVRCMVAILLLVGQGHEKATIVRDLLDVEKFPTKPVYDMASDLPLVLYDCEFEGVKWERGGADPLAEARILRGLVSSLYSTWHEEKLKETMARHLLHSVAPASEIEGILARDENGKELKLNQDGTGFAKPVKNYVALANRRRQRHFEEANEIWRQKKDRSNEE
ncbi:tRNA pseudouridine synthase [Saitoella complicata NRRL Y-17804]|nr:tRNA pseudouridine synthase [Saitoella complicata NRRL Y-17804]ODQ54698.1 tRNA pseudouridine synthase [Saitoella complicata NRRL Y-17804]